MTYKQLKNMFENELSENYSFTESSLLFEIFIQNQLNINRFEIRNLMDETLDSKVIGKFLEIIKELKTGKPYQQILGETEFYGLKFFVNEHVLIPRPETEELLELTLFKIRDLSLNKKHFKILDIGTGSGIIAIILKKNFPNSEIFALDLSENALKIAKKNAMFHQVEINFIEQDYLEENLGDIFDVIISNPPYIGLEEEMEIADSVKEFEPKMALFSPTSNALIFYQKIAEDCKKNLAENGFVFLEINQKLGKETLELFSLILKESELVKDLSGNERFVWGIK